MNKNNIISFLQMCLSQILIEENIIRVPQVFYWQEWYLQEKKNMKGTDPKKTAKVKVFFMKNAASKSIFVDNILFQQKRERTFLKL